MPVSGSVVRSGLVGWGVGALLALLVMVHAMFRSRSSTAAIGLFAPVYSAFWGLPAFVVGLCLGYLRQQLGAEGRPRLWSVSIAGLVAAGILGVAGFLLAGKLNQARQVRRVLSVDATELERVMEDPELRRDKFILAAIAQNRGATADILHRIAGNPDPALQQRMGSVFDHSSSDQAPKSE